MAKVNHADSDLDAGSFAARLAAATGPVLVVTHAKPDGDALGSVLALVTALRRRARGDAAAAHGLLVPPVPAALAARPGADTLAVWDDAAGAAGLPLAPADAALIVVVDTGAWSQVGPLRGFLEPQRDRTLVLDHHLTGDIPAAGRWVDPAAAAACEMVAAVIDRLDPVATGPRSDLRSDLRADPVIGEALFTGLASDTGWFRYSNVRPATFELAARLLRGGVDHAALYQALERSDRPEKLALHARGLASVTYFAGGRAAAMRLGPSDFAVTGARIEETEGLIDLPQRVGTVVVTALLTYPPAAGDDDALTGRLSLRSRHAADPRDTVNVSEMAAGFGGGGHARAAGATLTLPPDEAWARLAEALDDPGGN